MNEIDLNKQIQALNAKIDILLKAQTTISKYTFFEWLNIWFDTYKKPILKPNSIRNILGCINVHIKPNIEDKRLDLLSGVDIQTALNKVPTSRMRKDVYDVYHGCLRKALVLELLPKDIMLTVDTVKHKKTIGRALTQVEQVEFLKLIKKNKLENLYKFYIYTGCRKSEALSLKTEDVDFENNVLHIKGTKTDGSDRVIPLFDKVKKILVSITPKQGYYFPYSVNLVACNFKRLQRSYNLKYTIHSLRHSFATRCLENGISIKTVQKWLGHSRLDTTANIYMHVQSEFEKEEIKKFNKLF